MMKTSFLICGLILFALSIMQCSKPDDEVSGEIVYSSQRGDVKSDIYKMYIDGSHVKRLTTDPSYDREPSWSPDGSKITFVSMRDGNWEIYIMNSDGSNQTRLTQTGTWEDDFDPSFSPDGSKILFVGKRSHKMRICTMNIDGSNETILTADDDADYLNARYSPDGTHIAYTIDAFPNSHIGIMNADGTDTITLTTGSNRDFEPIFTLDGNRIVFCSYRGLSLFSDIYMMDTDGTNFAQITDTDGLDETSICFSPDGSQMTFAITDFDTQDLEIYIANADGSNQRAITNNQFSDYNPNWKN